MFYSTNLSINTYKYIHIVNHLGFFLAVSIGKQTRGSCQPNILFTNLDLRTAVTKKTCKKTPLFLTYWTNFNCYGFGRVPSN